MGRNEREPPASGATCRHRRFRIANAIRPTARLATTTSSRLTTPRTATTAAQTSPQIRRKRTSNFRRCTAPATAARFVPPYSMVATRRRKRDRRIPWKPDMLSGTGSRPTNNARTGRHFELEA